MQCKRSEDQWDHFTSRARHQPNSKDAVPNYKGWCWPSVYEIYLNVIFKLTIISVNQSTMDRNNQLKRQSHFWPTPRPHNNIWKVKIRKVRTFFPVFQKSVSNSSSPIYLLACNNKQYFQPLSGTIIAIFCSVPAVDLIKEHSLWTGA